ncbi:hypothetical protein NIES4072_55940 [Nostoc commune NIES-4072]|uniref:Conjugation TrbI family protein n=1 Tax=Nostoc commune NIES-4072 TaxID=2005467 RepID=A0A2R5FUD2_NOSCO|nr:TrbI/VirB10 family protein [Nostoc commune]BBD67111.1 hypothetical protein NIES4070_34990 [Nostoc commune HK-02]GBG21905.1 hypothetical protein NIES4072_55940 [Nostoc commune NIES-4072]
MTKYSTPAETPAQNEFTLPPDAQQQDVESFDWESRMSRLVGFDEESSPDTQGSEDVTSQESLSLPQEVQTKQPLSSNPFAKLGLVGAATFAIVLVGGVFLSQLMSSNPKPKTIVAPQVPEQPTDESTSQQLAGEVDTLKTKLALTEQAEMVKAAQQQLRTAKSASTVPLPQPSVSSRGTQRVIPTPPPTAYVPRTVTVERVVRVPASQPSPQLPVVQPSTQRQPQPVVNITPPSPPNPLQEWRRLAKLGSYGQLDATNQSNNIATAPEPVNNPQPQQQQTPPPPQTSAPEVSQAQPVGQKSLAVGTSARAVLATAISGETTTRSGGGDEGSQAKNVSVIIKSQEALKAKDGTTVIPANTEFLAEISSINEQGLVQMNVTKLISQNNGNPTEQSLPSNAIIVRGSQGKPLVASKYPGQSSPIASMDVGSFLVNGISKAAALINTPDTTLVSLPSTTTTTNSEGNTTPVTTYTTGTITENKRNLAAAVLEGGTTSLSQQIGQRNQQAIAQMSQPTNIWFMQAGTNVELYVNQPI